MAVTIYPATEEDSRALAECNIEAFQNDIVNKTLFGRSDDISPQKHEAEVTFRQKAFEHSMRKPDVHIFKAVDDSTGALAGFACFQGPESSEDDSGDKGSILDSLPSVFDRGPIEHWLGCITQTKMDLMGDKTDYWHLTNLGVTSEYQKRGIAQQLLQRGLDLADEQNSDVYLESSLAAEKLYARNGFEVLRWIEPLKGLWTAPMIRKARPRN